METSSAGAALCSSRVPARSGGVLSSVCRTFSVHKGSGICYLHDTWLCPQKAKYETGDSDIFSGVCRPEGGWDMYGRCFSF